MSNLLKRLLGKRDWLLADGATGTNLFALGLQHGDAPEQWNLNNADRVRAHYRSFIQAGSDIVLTNTFGGTANRLKLHKLDDRVHEINWIAAQLLAGEIRESGRAVVCAGSVGPTGDLFEPVGPLTFEAGVAAFTEQMTGLRDGGVDVAWIETMSSADELRAALAAATAVGLPVVCTMSFDTNGRTMMGVSTSDLVTLVRSSGFDPVAFGGNCGTGAPNLMAGLLSAQDVFQPDDVIVAKANCGIPEFVDGEICYSGSQELMAEYAVLARDAGARIIGGCCGTTPDHVRAMRQALEETPKAESPTLEQIIERLGPLTGNTADLFMTRDRRDDSGSRGGRRGRRGRQPAA